MTKKRTILVIVAHNDDHLIGAGGTLAKYAKQGKKIKTIIFSYGEKSHPHLKPGEIKKERYKESIEADRILGGSGVIYLGLEEGKFAEQFRKKKLRKKLGYLINLEKPEKIFTIGPGDAHPDHRAVSKIVQGFIRDKTIKCDVYGFEVWTPIQMRKRNVPKLIVDISDTFKIKGRALAAHKSQSHHIMPFILVFRIKMWLQSIISGWSHGYKYVEVFSKLN